VSGRRAVWEVARRELLERSRSRVLRAVLVLLVVLSAGGAVAAARLGGGTPTDTIALVGGHPAALEAAIRAQARVAGRHVRLRWPASAAAASRAVAAGQVDVALLQGDRLVVKTTSAQPAVRIVEQAVAIQRVLDRLRAGGLTRAQALSALRPPALPVDVLHPRPRSYDRNRAMVSAGLIALLIVLVFFGQAVAQGVTEEKSSRVVELLLTTLTPRRLLAGKILGIGLLGLALLLLPGAAALAAGALAGGAGLPSVAPATIALIVLWFILGYVFYSVAFAVVGALVSRQEDLNTAMLPVNVVLVASFYLAIFVVNADPNGTVARIAAFVPPASPMVVPARMVLGDMNALGLAVAVALEVIGTVAVISLGARAYERAILRIGAPVKLRRLFAGGLRPLALALVAMGVGAGALGLGGGGRAAAALAAAPSTPRLVGIRAGHSGGTDRVVFEFAGGLPARRSVRYVERLIADPSGRPVAIAGRAIVAVSFRPAVAHDIAGRSTAPDRVAFALPNVVEVVRSGDFESVLSYGIGVSRRTSLRVFTLRHPDRVVIDLGAAFRTVRRRVYFFNPGRFAANRAPFVTGVERRVPASTPATGLLDRLFAGPTAGERAAGLRLLRSGATGFARLSIVAGIARLRLTGGCSSGGSTVTIAQEIVPTLKQLPGVAFVKIYDPSGHTERPDGHTDSIPICLEP